ncbi:MAG: nucleotide kinase domain-containing protein, partial [Parasphingorhabdus sp.]
NAYRVLDRVSQYLISDVQRCNGVEYGGADVIFRTLLFKIFNRIDTWELLNAELDEPRANSFDFEAASRVLSARMKSKKPIYSAAYIMPSPNFGYGRKHDNHLRLLHNLVSDGGITPLLACKTLEDLYRVLKALPGLGPFLAFQFAADLGYTSQFAVSETDFVVAGPGARDGIAKCFVNWRDYEPEQIIMFVYKIQEAEFAARNIRFDGLNGRLLQPIDCQNLFCEVSKYARMAHPGVQGVDGRVRIKQKYVPRPLPLREPVFPAHWNVAKYA